MRSCPTLNNNITTNNHKTMMEDAPNATDHDDDSKRIASSYSYDLPNQEPNQDGDVSLVPPDILTIADIFNFNRTEIALLMKEIKLKVGIPIQSNNIPSVSDRTVSIVKSPTPSSSSNDNKLKRPSYINTKAPSSSSNDNRLKRSSSNNNKATSSSECVINYDTNFDRDNPISSHDRSLPTNLLPATTNNNNIPSVSYNVLSNRTDNNFNPPPSERAINSDANFDRDNPSPWSNINNNNVSNHNNNNDYSNNNDYNNNAWKASSLNNNKLQSSLNAPPLSSNINNINGLNNNNFVTDNNDINGLNNNNFVTDNNNINGLNNNKVVTDTRTNTTAVVKLPSVQLIKPPSTLLSNVFSPPSESKLVPYNSLSDRTPKAIKSKVGISTQSKNIPSVVSYHSLSDRTSNANKSPPPPSSEHVTNSDANFDRDNPSLSALLSNVLSDRTSHNIKSPSLQSVKPPSLPSIKSPPSVRHLSTHKASPLSNNNNKNNNNNNNNVLNQNSNNIMKTTPVTVKITRAVKITRKVNGIKILGMIHTTKYAATENHATSTKTPSSRSKFSIAHEEASTATPKISSTRSRTSIAHEETQSKYAATENQITEKWKFSSPMPKFSSSRSRTSIAHKEARSMYAATETHAMEKWKFSPPQSKILIAHEELCSNYAATENHVKSWSTHSNISIAHEEASSTAIPNVLKSSELSSTRPNNAVAHEETSVAIPIEAIKSSESSQAGSNISITHEEVSTEKSKVSELRSENLSTHEIRDKPTFKLKINMVLLDDGMDTKCDCDIPMNAHFLFIQNTLILGLKGYNITPTLYEPYDTKYDISTEQTSTLIVNNSSFCSQYLQTVQKITNNNNNNNNNIGIFNNIMLLLLHPIIQIHPFIEYLQPEPEPPPLNSYFLLFLFLFIGKTKQKVVLFILKSLTLIKHNNSETLSYINIKTVLTHHVWSSSSFFCSTYIF